MTETNSPVPPAMTETYTPTPVRTPTALNPTASITPTITPLKLGCDQSQLILPGHYFLARPIGPDYQQRVDTFYRYASTRNGTLKVHHGVEFKNNKGTSVYASAAGKVIAAGDDSQMVYGQFENFYGNLVIIEHEFPEFGQKVFTLYAHLSAVLIEPGVQVSMGELIGEVGSSGIAVGSHLHFEVRVGENSYAATRNPELWLQPLVDEDGRKNGGLAGIVLDQEGNAVELDNIVIKRVSETKGTVLNTVFVESYNQGLINSDARLGESFGVGDLEPGNYVISYVYETLYVKNVVIEEGQLTFLPLCVESLN